MAKQNIMISIDRELYDFHRKAGTNVSQACNSALANFEGIKPGVEQLKEVAIQKVSEGSAAIEAAEAAKAATQAELIAQLKQQGAELVSQQKWSLQKDIDMLRRTYTSCAQRPDIPPESWAKAIHSAAERQGMTLEKMHEIAIPQTFIDKVTQAIKEAKANEAKRR